MKYIYVVLFFSLTLLQIMSGQTELWRKLAADPICLPDGGGNTFVANAVSLTDRVVSEYDASGNMLWSRTFQNWDGMYYHQNTGLVVAANDSLNCIIGGGDLGGSTVWWLPAAGKFLGGSFDADGNFYYCVFGATILGEQVYAAKATVSGVQQFVTLLPSSRYAVGFVDENFVPLAADDGTVRVIKMHQIGKTKTMGGGSSYEQTTYHTLLRLNASSGAIELNKQFLKDATIKYKNNGKGTTEYWGLQYPSNYLMAKGKVIFGGKFISTYDKEINSMNVKKKYVSDGRVFLIDAKAKVKAVKLTGKGRVVTTSPAAEIDTMTGFNTFALDDSGNVYAGGGLSWGKTKNGIGNYTSYSLVERINVDNGKVIWKQTGGSSLPLAARKIIFHPSREIYIWNNAEGYRNAISRVMSANGGSVFGPALFLADDIAALHPTDGSDYFYVTLTSAGFYAFAKYFAAPGNAPIQLANNAQTMPEQFALQQNYPNPFNPSTTIGFTIQEAGFTTLSVYNMLGQEVATLVNEVREQGEYSIQWDASAMPSGMYMYRLTVQPLEEGAAPFQSVKTMTLVK